MIYFEKRPSKKITFRKYIYRKTVAQDIVFSALSIFLTYTFIKVPSNFVFLNIFFTLLILFVMFIFIFPLSNTFTTFRLSSRLDISEVTDTTSKERSELLELVHAYPFRKAKQSFICYIVQFFLLSIKYFLLFKTDIKLCAAMFIIGVCLAYTGGIFTYAITEKECSEIGKKIMEEGITLKGMQRKFFAIQTKKLFLFYQFIPFILTSLSIFTAIYISRISFVSNTISSVPTHAESAFRLKSVIVLTVMGNIFLVRQFYSNLRAHLTHIEKTLTLINPHNISRIELFSVDLINEISYTMYLLNKTVVKFRDIMKNTRSINSQIKNSSELISDISAETEKTVEIQCTNIEAILSEMNSTDENSVLIKTKLNEVTNVSQKTLDDIKNIFESFNQNLLKMQEITESNSFTIKGIEKLSLKINGIWDIVNLIDNMAEQTKIIAFNAELVSNTMKDETFKNVASEIRNLADSVMTLTGQIRKKISEIQDSAQELIDSGKNCMKKIEEGNILSNLLREHFETINNSASITAEETESITGSIQTQISAFKMILISMDRIYEALKKHASANTISAIETLRTNSAHIEQLVPEEAEL